MPVDPFSPSRHLLYADYTVLCSRPDGTISDDPEGLFDHDTRVLSRRRLTIDGHDLTFVSSGDLAHDRRLTTLLAKQTGGEAGGPKLPQDAIEVRIETRVGPGMAEDITLINRSMIGLTPEIRLEVDGDFADVQEIGGARRQKGKTTGTRREDGGLELVYRAVHGKRRLERGVRLIPTASTTTEISGSGTFVWRPELGPGASWSVALRVESLVDGRWRGPASDRRRDNEAEAWRRTRSTVESTPSLLGRAVDRAMEDLFALRDRELDGDTASAWIPNAGVPTYTGVFGRDTLTVGWQSALLGPEISRGALGIL
ncbi:MAG: hypothetical protein H0X16_11720, partial [Chloroflexi bacterium]|nr:hypothetical protein [Chloroflexota bacterium]